MGQPATCLHGAFAQLNQVDAPFKQFAALSAMEDVDLFACEDPRRRTKADQVTDDHLDCEPIMVSRSIGDCFARREMVVVPLKDQALASRTRFTV